MKHPVDLALRMFFMALNQTFRKIDDKRLTILDQPTIISREQTAIQTVQ